MAVDRYEKKKNMVGMKEHYCKNEAFLICKI